DCAHVESKETCRAVRNARAPVACDRRLECQALDRAEEERRRCGDIGRGWQIGPSNRVFEKRRYLAVVPSMQSVKLLVQRGALVANVAREHALSRARIF